MQATVNSQSLRALSAGLTACRHFQIKGTYETRTAADPRSHRRYSMGYGRWRDEDFRTYAGRNGRKVRKDGTIDTAGETVQSMYRGRTIDPALDPNNVIRECCENEEHPNTLPVILALDVTGSMGRAAMEVAAKLNEVIIKLLGTDMDIEFMVMGIGDLAYDRAPIQISQFESDIRIAEQLDKIYFEGGGGGNSFESYTAAWYMGARHTKLDCVKRGRRGLIITLGDEPLNPYLPKGSLAEVTGDALQGDVETKALFHEVRNMYEVYHIHVIHGSDFYGDRANHEWRKILDKNHLRFCKVNEISSAVTKIITDTANAAENTGSAVQQETKPVMRALRDLISW